MTPTPPEVVPAQVDIEMASTICNPIDNPHMFRILCKKFSRHRLATIEECAKVCDDHAARAWEISAADGQNPVCASGRNHGARDCATAIRNLAPPPPPVDVGEGEDG